MALLCSFIHATKGSLETHMSALSRALDVLEAGVKKAENAKLARAVMRARSVTARKKKKKGRGHRSGGESSGQSSGQSSGMYHDYPMWPNVVC